MTKMAIIKNSHGSEICVVFYAYPCWSILNSFKAQHTGFLGADLEALAGWPVSGRVVAPNLNKVVGVCLHTLQPGMVLPAGHHHPLGPSLTVFMIPPVLHLGHTRTEMRWLGSKTGLYTLFLQHL